MLEHVIQENIQPLITDYYSWSLFTFTSLTYTALKYSIF